MIARYRKAFAAAGGAATPAAVLFVLGLFGVHVDPGLVGALPMVLAGVATAWAPANAPKLSPVSPVPRYTVSTTEPTPDAATVVGDVHKVLDTAKADAQSAIDAVTHLDLGVLADEAKRLVHDGIELLKQRIHDLLHGASVPPQAPPAV